MIDPASYNNPPAIYINPRNKKNDVTMHPVLLGHRISTVH
jgi:hypothetical protein